MSHVGMTGHLGLARDRWRASEDGEHLIVSHARAITETTAV
jgi:hypothetical protein